MNKELIDKAWACLPRDFKEKVKFEYHRVATKARKEEYDLGFMHAHEGMFGIHNLTSYTEGEEVLTVSRKKVQEEYAIISEELSYHDAGTKDYTAWHYIKMIFEEFFGSKCLQDSLSEVKRDLSEPKGDKPFYNILKDSFREHNRLHIAAQIVASMIGSDDWTTWRGSSNKEIWHNMAKSSLEIADALIAEAEKGGK